MKDVWGQLASRVGPQYHQEGELGERDRASGGGAPSFPQLQRGSRRRRAERTPETEQALS